MGPVCFLFFFFFIRARETFPILGSEKSFCFKVSIKTVDLETVKNLMNLEDDKVTFKEMKFEP